MPINNAAGGDRIKISPATSGVPALPPTVSLFYEITESLSGSASLFFRFTDYYSGGVVSPGVLEKDTYYTVEAFSDAGFTTAVDVTSWSGSSNVMFETPPTPDWLAASPQGAMRVDNGAGFITASYTSGAALIDLPGVTGNCFETSDGFNGWRWNNRTYIGNNDGRPSEWIAAWNSVDDVANGRPRGWSLERCTAVSPQATASSNDYYFYDDNGQWNSSLIFGNPNLIFIGYDSDPGDVTLWSDYQGPTS